MNRANKIIESINENHDYPEMEKRIETLIKMKKTMSHDEFISEYGKELTLMRKTATNDKTASYDLWRKIDILQEKR